MPESEKVALVTGSGQGIGRGIALRLARDGFAVVTNGSSPTKTGPAEVRDAIRTAGGCAEAFRADISKREERDALVDFVLERFGRIDLLVNNAGVAPLERRDMLEATEESFDRLIAINLKGPYFLSQRVANEMIAQRARGVAGTPRICFVSSISAYTSSPNRGEYCVSKAGLNMAAQLFAHRLGEEGIPVLCLTPGIIETPMTAGVKEKYDRLIAEGLLVTPRWGTPEDVADAVAAFAAGMLDYCTGAVLEVGGGFGLRRL